MTTIFLSNLSCKFDNIQAIVIKTATANEKKAYVEVENHKNFSFNFRLLCCSNLL